MPNPHRGEIEACLDGKSFRLCLTLSSLAELEHAFQSDDMLALAERFRQGRLSARDAQRIIGAGLRGAGHDIADEAVGRMQAEGGAAGFVDIVARLLSATFAGPAAPVAAAVAGQIVAGLAEDLGTRPKQPGAEARPPRLLQKGPDAGPSPRASPSPLRGAAGGGGKAAGTGGGRAGAGPDQERETPFPFPGPT
jgi:hypothetical protein